MKREVNGKKVVVIGGGKSGLASAKLLKKHGATVFLSERNPMTDAQKELVDELRKNKIEYEFGEHTAKVLSGDFIVISPGVPSNAPVVQQAAKYQIPIYSEIEMSSWFCKAKLVAITGTNGKTTTTTLITKILQRDGGRNDYKAYALGNIGNPFADYVEEMTERDVAVVETSSFQLDYCFSYKPKVAIITNITENHLDRYENNFEKYEEAKYRIYQSQDKDDVLIYNEDDEKLSAHFKNKAVLESLKQRVIPISLNKNLSRRKEAGYLKNGWLMLKLNGLTQKLMTQEEVVQRINFRGRHNVYNSLAAAVAARALEVQNETIRESITAFEGVEHRIEFVRDLNGINFINDSKSTSVNALWYALDTIPAPIVLIIGGRDKGNVYEKVLIQVKEKVKAIIALGESKEKIVAAFSGVTTVITASSMDEAVKLANREARKGDTVMLSPACSSFDMFSGFEERGEVYKRLVASL